MPDMIDNVKIMCYNRLNIMGQCLKIKLKKGNPTMKKFLAVLLSALLVAAVFAIPVAAINWEDNQVQGANPEKPEDYTFDNAYEYVFNINYVNGKIVGEDNTIIDNVDSYNACNPNWAISVLLAPTSEANVYEVALEPVVTPGSAAAAIEKGINFDNGNIVLVAHSSYSNPNGANWQSKLAACALKVGDKITVTETTATVQAAPAGYGEGEATVKETITVDGDLSDNGWTAEGWIEVTPENGFWQTIPTTEDTLSYKYQLRTDDTKLYVAFEIDCAMVEGGNGNGTNIRFWINTDSEATVYTHFYDVCVKEGAVAYVAKYNTVKDANTSANIENSTINGIMTGEGEKTYVEFSVDLAEFNGAEGFSYFVCVSNKVNENVCLYYPANDEPAEGESRTANLPYGKWNTEKAAVVDVEAIKLGEVKEEGGNVVESVNVAAGKSYTTSPLFRQNESWSWGDDAPIAYPDEDGITLTDGIFPAEGAAFGDAEWAGFNSKFPGYETTGYHWITLDLGESMDLAKYVLFYGTKALANGIGAPTGVEVYVSEDGETWGEAVGTATPVNDETTVNESVVIEANATGRYVQFRFTSNGWAFVSEIEVYNAGSEGAGSEDKPSIKEDIEPALKELLGAANEDAKFDVVITAPETYEAGDEITVTVEVKNITAENGLHLVKFELLYDNEKLVLTNDLDEYDNNCVDCFNAGEALPNKWTNFTKVNNDYDPNGSDADNEVVEALNDGVIYCSVLTTQLNPSFAVKEDGAITFTFTFKALEDAEGDIGLVVPNANIEGALNTKDGADVYTGNGTYAIIETIVEDEPSKPSDPVVPGDASSMLVFAIIALVAIAGSAIVVKTRK